MHWNIFIIPVGVLLLLHHSDGLSKDYIDLLDLVDNDDFQWGLRENLIAQRSSRSNHSNNNDTSDALYTQHHLRKRQTSGDSNELEDSKDFGECTTPSREAGRCLPSIYCRMPELKDDIWGVVAHLCHYGKNKIGICCPDRVRSRVGPQIITTAEAEEPRIVNHPEQRGCGITTKQFPRITGGRPAEPDEWPWMAAILRPGLPYVWCGGVLVTDRHVLTAAHCVHKLRNDQLIIRLGEYNTHLLNETRARDMPIANMVTHIDYNPLTFENDIALVRVERPAMFNTYIWPICMPPIGENWEGRIGVVTGWGTKTFGGPHAEILMEVLLPVWRLEDCKKAFVERIPDTVLCAGAPEGGKDSCQGDSGGPLLVQLPNRRWVTIGIVSWGIRCGEKNRPGVYTRVDKYLHWIIENSDI